MRPPYVIFGGRQYCSFWVEIGAIMAESESDPGAAIAESKAERKRLAIARGLLTRERNKLAGERDSCRRWRRISRSGKRNCRKSANAWQPSGRR